MSESTTRLKSKALAALARREHSRAELSRKLAPFGDQAEIGEVLDDLALARLQSDTRYVESYVRARASRGYGPKRIEVELKQRGVASDEVRAALAATEEDWVAHAVRADRKKFGEVAQDSHTRLKRRQHLEYRGYRLEQIKAVLDESLD